MTSEPFAEPIPIALPNAGARAAISYTSLTCTGVLLLRTGWCAESSRSFPPGKLTSGAKCAEHRAVCLSTSAKALERQAEPEWPPTRCRSGRRKS